eukprot:Unigene189_Nuclearia_a/m.679 Unigene189_Nuclearia_a/g.679  ORF Unigene189_Nuclearia_a/g.679 Unigene189_Nuclearia_a/m.679 type:complete len:135 (+) Unigene189_Nuclearia_a:3-407(+)
MRLSACLTRALHQNSARAFLRGIATSGSGMEDRDDVIAGAPVPVTPYLHALVAHLPAHLRTCARLGVPLTNLSTEPVEKKNHQHASFYFTHTTHGGGSLRKSAVLTTMEKENRSLYRPPPLLTNRVHHVVFKSK